jgi:hypothetical protein
VVTEQQPTLNDRWLEAGPPRRTNSDAIRAGLGFILAQQQGGRWPDLGLPSGEADVRFTACVLARLSDLPLHYISRRLQHQMDQAVDWLLEARTPDGGWGSGSGRNEADAETTAWAVLALRGHRRAPSHRALNFLRRCRRLDGGFAARPADSPAASPYLKSTAEITALALRTLGEADRSSQEFLSAQLKLAAHRPASGLLVCFEILDWDRGQAAPFLLHQVAQFVGDAEVAGAMEQSLLLRCLLRLRQQRAWTMAAQLRALQAENGSWSGRERPKAPGSRFDLDDRRVLATATAVSALALAEFQPGLYFGSDLPAPQRLPAIEGW